MKHFVVASFTDAWIETFCLLERLSLRQSHLLQMRGLKQAFESGKDLNTVSHLLQMRGLKRLSLRKIYFSIVASFTDAWIETYSKL